jgi:purine-binding chemotaxis protein CheW
MTNPLAASRKVMKNYLSELMTDDDVEIEEVEVKQNLEKLLNKVNVAETSLEDKVITHKSAFSAKPAIKESVELSSKEVTSTSDELLSTPKSSRRLATHKSSEYSRDSFQAMFFDVAGLTVAVPLVELGGIHTMAELNHLMGKPDWFSGVMIYRDEKINVVDTAKWVMPEKCDDKLVQRLNYQYIIMLGNSTWGLSAEHLVDTVTLTEDDVKWLDTPSKRPWLAGLVKDRMCALIDVESLIKLLNDGENVYQK